MSASKEVSPSRGLTSQQDESTLTLPAGQCRYILTQPEIKGQRCACVNFYHNKSIPAAMCECGHLACYHSPKADASSHEPALDDVLRRMQALENECQANQYMRQRLRYLEAQLVQISQREQKLMRKVNLLEGTVDKKQEEVKQEFKTCYRNLERSWNSVAAMEHHSQQVDAHVRHLTGLHHGLGTEVQRLSQRQLEISDENISLDERLLVLEESEPPGDETKGIPDPKDCQAGPKSMSQLPMQKFNSTSTNQVMEPEMITKEPQAGGDVMGMPLRPSSDRDSTLWTVHVSLLPSASQPFAFERDTTAYKRCLSRGLHQMVVVNGLDVPALTSAIERAFSRVLRGRTWMPLQALPCTADHVAGLPMLRKLDESLLHGRYDMKFLQDHCGVLNAAGKIDSLYITMKSDTLSWHELRRCPIWMDGLEASWVFDRLLDPTNSFESAAEDEEDEESAALSNPAGDVTSVLPSLKRAASDISRSSSFGSASTTFADGEVSRQPKMARLPSITEVRPSIKTA